AFQTRLCPRVTMPISRPSIARTLEQSAYRQAHQKSRHQHADLIRDIGVGLHTVADTTDLMMIRSVASCRFARDNKASESVVNVTVKCALLAPTFHMPNKFRITVIKTQ